MTRTVPVAYVYLGEMYTPEEIRAKFDQSTLADVDRLVSRTASAPLAPQITVLEMEVEVY